MSQSTQGSITIKRLRNGDSLYLTLELNGKPLYQGIDKDTLAVTPDWGDAANQPVITPKAASVRGNSVTLSNFGWSNNGVEIVFNGATSGNWKTDSTGKFSLNLVTGALKIIGNLASEINTANDSLTFTCQASVGGVEYNLAKSIDVIIQLAGASSYFGSVIASTEQITEAVTTSTLTTKLMLASQDLADYYVKWYKDDTLWSDKNGQKTITVGRADIDGTQLFIAEFFRSSSDTTPIYRTGIRITDTLDDMQVICYISSENKEVDTGKPVTVSAKIVNMRTNATVSPSYPVWRMDVMEKSTWTSIKSSATNSITVTTDETDRNGEQNDVEVTAEVTWNE